MPTAFPTSRRWRPVSPVQTPIAATPDRSFSSVGRRRTLSSSAFFEAAQQAGYSLTDDVNGFRQEGFARFDQNLHRGRRLSAARAYLHPAMGRPNLDVVTRANVMGIRFQQRRATGVEYRTWRGERRTVAAGEVILCGGAFNSPQLLQVSGVGDGDHLRDVGVPVVHHLPGVGANLQDHLEVYVQHAASQPVSLNPLLAWYRRPWIGLQWIVPQGTGNDEPLRGGRVRAQQRRRRLPEPDVPLPADRRALRRLAPRRSAWLPGARRADELRRARLRAHRFARRPGQAGAAIQLPVDPERPPRVGRGNSRRPQHPRPAGIRPVRRR